MSFQIFSSNGPDVGSQISYEMTGVNRSGCAVRGSMGRGWIVFAGLAPFAPGRDPSILYLSAQFDIQRYLSPMRDEYEWAKIMNKWSHVRGIAPEILQESSEETTRWKCRDKSPLCAMRQETSAIMELFTENMRLQSRHCRLATHANRTDGYMLQ
jgi:hypothetical protein